MQRILTTTIFLLTLGLAFAQPPVDYTLLCEVEVEGDVEVQTTVVGAASYVDGELHVALDEGWTCEGTLTVEQDPGLSVDIGEPDETTGETTVTVGETSGVARTVPEEAIAGMVGAQKNRAMAADHRAAAQQKADEARERGEGAPDDVEDAPEEHLPEDLPDDLPETPDDEGDESDAASERANEVSGGNGPEAKPEEPGQGRP